MIEVYLAVWYLTVTVTAIFLYRLFSSVPGAVNDSLVSGRDTRYGAPGNNYLVILIGGYNFRSQSPR